MRIVTIGSEAMSAKTVDSKPVNDSKSTALREENEVGLPISDWSLGVLTFY